MTTALTTQAARPQFKFALLVLAGGLLGALGAGVAGAEPADDSVPSVVVRYQDLSLATDDGVKTLYRRIARAATQVCPEETRANLSVHTVIEACRQQAIARAVQQIHNSRLAALHAAHAKQG
jgi:UrcA family protein